MSVMKITVVLLFVFVSLVSAQWDMVDMGEGANWMRPLVVGSVKPASINSIFAANFDRNLYHFSWSGGVWEQEIVANFRHNVQRMCIGNARNSGIISNLYVACGDTHIYEFIWNFSESRWDSHRIRTPYHANWGVVVGQGRNDGINRLYVACYNSHIYEYTWVDSDWVMVDVGTSDTTYGEPFYDVAIGKGRNDDTLRIYGSSQNDFGSYGAWEFTWNGSVWVREPVRNIADGFDIYSIAVGEGRNDGIVRVYAGGNNGSIAEFTWNGSDWERTSCPHAGETKWSIFIGDGRNEIPPHNRVYHACHDGHIYESTWNGSGWDIVDVGSGISAPYEDNNMWGVGIGEGRNDGIRRVYASNYNGHLYEFTYPGAQVEEATVPLRNSIYVHPNPMNYSCVIVAPNDAELAIYDIRGNLVVQLEINNSTSIVWDGSDNSRNRLPTGIYFIRDNNNGSLAKVVLMN